MNYDLEELIGQLSEYLNIPLELDHRQTCRIVFGNKKFDIQIQLDKYQEHILLGSKVYELSPGRYREEVLKSALKANFVQDYPVGILSYTTKLNALMLWHSLPLDNIDGEAFIKIFMAFYEKARQWNDALERGQRAPDNAFAQNTDEKPPMFGLKP